MSEKVRVDVSEMTLGEMAEATEAAGDPGAGGFNFRQTAALAWIAKRRSDPGFTFEDALRLKMADIDVVEQLPEVSGAENGATPPASLASGSSILPTS